MRQFAAGVLVGLVVGLAVGGFLVFREHKKHEVTQPKPTADQAFSPVTEETGAVLANRFRPRLMFDSAERWHPLALNGFFAEGTQRFCERVRDRTTACEPLSSLDDFATRAAEAGTFGRSTYVDIAGKGGFKEYRDGPGAEAIYYRVSQSNRRFYIDYWFFYRFNHFKGFDKTCSTRVRSPTCDEHEGDWEGVTLVTKPGSEDELDYAAYAAHKGVFRYPADQLDMSMGRPAVFVAFGSHASYPVACAKKCVQPIAIEGLIDTPETSTDGRRPWARNDDACDARPGNPDSCLQPLPRPEFDNRPWTAWPGLWGATCGDRCGIANSPNAPASPGLQSRFQAPWCSSQGGIVSCDGVVQGCSDWLGPVVVALACDPRLLGQGLRVPEELAAGRLSLTVSSLDKVSATRPGIVQVIDGQPLRPGSVVKLGNGRPETQVLIRAQDGRTVLEARFDPIPAQASGAKPLTAAERTFEVRIGEGPTAVGARAGEEVGPVEERRVRLPPPPS
jgi:hypothetical protein